MKLNEIKAEAVLAGKLWVIEPGSESSGNPTIRPSEIFTQEDFGLFSAVLRIHDGSEHLALVMKSFPQGGDDMDIFIHRNSLEREPECGDANINRFDH